MNKEEILMSILVVLFISFIAWLFIEEAIYADDELREQCYSKVEQMVASNFDKATVDCLKKTGKERFSAEDWTCKIKIINPETNEITSQEGKKYHYPCSWDKQNAEGEQK